MKIQLVSDELNRPATELAVAILRQGSQCSPGIEFEAVSYSRLSSTRSEDVVLLMGYDARPSVVKTYVPNGVFGIVDPRPMQLLDLAHVDFLLPNGFESWQQWRTAKLPQALFFLNETPSNKISGIAPQFVRGGSTCFGYLGNAVHLRRLSQVAGSALHRLSKNHDLRFSLLVSDQVAPRDWKWLPSDPVIFRIGERTVDDFMSTVDIGLVPQLRPRTAWDSTTNALRRFSRERNNVVDLSFKPTTNPGRLLSFAQFQKPVVVESTPSVNQLIGERFKEFVVLDSATWECALEFALLNPEARREFADFLGATFDTIASPSIQVKRIVELSGEILALRVSEER